MARSVFLYLAAIPPDTFRRLAIRLLRSRESTLRWRFARIQQLTAELASREAHIARLQQQINPLKDLRQVSDDEDTWANPYAVLGLRRDAHPDVVRAAYRALVKIHHPDHGGSDEQLRHVIRAYEAIRKPGRN
jgi:hypothetical protein